jgi:hypothetical protein
VCGGASPRFPLYRRSSGTCPCRQDHWVQNGCGRIMYSRTMGRIRKGQRVRRCTHRSQVGTATCLPAGRAERYMATQPLSRTLKPAVPGGHAIWSARVLASTGRCVTRQPGTRPTSPTSPTGPTQHVASKSPRGGWQRHPDVRWSESRATSNECERTTKPRSGESASAWPSGASAEKAGNKRHK